MRILLVGSGTGGHFYPLIAIAEGIISRAKKEQREQPQMYFMGPAPYDSGTLLAYNITFLRCPAGKMRRYSSFKNIFDVFKTIGGMFVALYKLFMVYPDAVISKGGYTSVPVVFAAWLLRIPIVIHESDVRPGRANIFAKRFARYIAVSYAKTADYFPSEKTALTGIPIRTELLAPAPPNPRQTLGVTEGRPLIFVLGGSTGAERINDLIASALETLLPTYTILHQVGDKNITVMKETSQVLVEEKGLLEHYHIRGFLDVTTMHAALSGADIVISRAGSTSIHEIAAHAQPSVLIPIPEDISHDQRENAYTYARTGAATVIEEHNLTPHLLAAEIERIMTDQNALKEMRFAASEFARTDAADKIAEILIAIGREHE